VDDDAGRWKRCGWDGGDWWKWQSRPWGVRWLGRVGREVGDGIMKMTMIKEA